MTSPPLTKHVLAGKRIVVAGAGIAGLAFARALDLNWPEGHPKPEVVLYERSAEILDRSRDGYTMGIKSESETGGLRALQAIGLSDIAIRNSTTDAGAGQQMPSCWTKDWKLMFKRPSSAPAPGELPISIRLVRHVLRQILLDALPASTKIHYSTGIDSATLPPSSSSSSQIRLTLSNSTTTTCDLLIAADGANSAIRSSLLPSQTLLYAGANIYMGTSRFPNGKPPILSNDWGMSISGQGIAFLTFPVDAHTGVWALTYTDPTPGPKIRGQEAVDRYDEILNVVKNKGKMFAQPFGEFVEATDPVTLSAFSAMQKYPVNHAPKKEGEKGEGGKREEEKEELVGDGRVVFIGDANHAMSPFSGNGANMALGDAVVLAKELAQNQDSVERAIERFDEESIPRSSKAIDVSWYVIRLLHVKGLLFWVLRGLLTTLNAFLDWKMGSSERT